MPDTFRQPSATDPDPDPDAPGDAHARAERIQRRLRELGALTGEIVDRPGWSAAETAAHELVAGWMAEAGLTVEIDPAGNLHGTRPGNDRGDGIDRGDRGAPEMWIGSHLDTVPNGGLYDGALGVLIGLEAVARLEPRPLGAAVIAWRDEEGTRFGLGCNGARALTGRLNSGQLALTDADGVTLAAAIGSVGAEASDAGWMVRPPAAYLEPHIEQGAILDEAGLAIAVVSGSVARVRLDVHVQGAPGHAATPLSRRRDAGLVAARIVLDARALAERHPPAVATVGAVTFTPGARNVVPERADLYLDMRAPTEGALDALLAAFRARAVEAADTHGCTVSTTIRQHEPAIRFAAPILDALRVQVDPGSPELVSWGGHDALIVAQAGVPTAMLYLASAHDGAAHSPLEYTETEVIARALDATTDALRRLTDRTPQKPVIR